MNCILPSFFNKSPAANIAFAKRCRTVARLTLFAALGVAFAGQANAQVDVQTSIVPTGSNDMPFGTPGSFFVNITNDGQSGMSVNGVTYTITVDPPMQNMTAFCAANCAAPPTQTATGFTGTLSNLGPNATASIDLAGNGPGGSFNVTIEALVPAGTTDTNSTNNQATTTTLPVSLQQFDVD